MNIRWQVYFMRIAREVAKNSRCLSRQIGAVIVRDNSILSTGYNGPPRGVPHCGDRHKFDADLATLFSRITKEGYDVSDNTKCPRQRLGFESGKGLEYCVATHAEVNAIVNAAREGTSLKYSTMILTCGIPCRNCLSTIINAGISQVIVSSSEPYDTTSEYILQCSDLLISQYEGD